MARFFRWLQPQTPAIVAALVFWTFACTFVRAIPAYAYAANVASFSAALIMVASSIDGSVQALNRIDLTLFGVVIYVVVSNIVFPMRSSKLVRLLVRVWRKPLADQSGRLPT